MKMSGVGVNSIPALPVTASDVPESRRANWPNELTWATVFTPFASGPVKQAAGLAAEAGVPVGQTTAVVTSTDGDAAPSNGPYRLISVLPNATSRFCS